ncbi:MAG: Chemotaxis protein methyltransferase Cher2 [bacterium ADurb.Bin429]|nr:MAG: Chemotaxis protein methyltransferase Cher2 [bacterium ADurb.Bin429]
MPSQSDDAKFEELLEYLSYTRGFDFGAYKRPGLRRRIEKRMGLLGVGNLEAYRDYLEVHQEEIGHLFDSILINVTSFFRDTPAWEYLVEEGFPQILRAKDSHETIRVWSAGCSNGAEAYTVAMLLFEFLGGDDFRQRVKIYATDIDESALLQARAGVYTTSEVAGMPKELLERYFTYADSRYTFRPDLRRAVIFGQHNLLADAPISHLDLLLCRNVLNVFQRRGAGTGAGALPLRAQRHRLALPGQSGNAPHPHRALHPA